MFACGSKVYAYSEHDVNIAVEDTLTQVYYQPSATS